MKKVLVIIFSVIGFFVLLFAIYWNLPITITRKSDINFGNELIKKIEVYKNKNGKLPEVNDWKTLEKLGLQKEDLQKPIYTKDQIGNYELFYNDGLGGPFLIWNSQEKKWTIDFLKIVSK